MQQRRRSSAIAVMVALAGGMGLASAVCAEPDERTVSLAAHESARGSGDAVLSVDEVSDSRCRTAERCSASEAVSRDAAVQLTLRAADGRRYAATLAIGAGRDQPSPSAPAFARMGDQLVALVDIAPAGRELPADGPGRVQRATLRLTPADRVLVQQGATTVLPRAGFDLRVVSIDDQRCPNGVACITAGHVQVDVELSAKGAPAERMVFGAPTAPRRAQTWRGHEVVLCGVSPRQTGPAAAGSTPPLQVDFFVSRVPAVRRGAPAAQALAEPACAPIVR
ncbi:hypothetical protein [Ideonella sp.]|uniref:hypothetical protein n=1 Tax=Ideonella sp. TaxID=1929293 RepID=UPI0035AE999C